MLSHSVMSNSLHNPMDCSLLVFLSIELGLEEPFAVHLVFGEQSSTDLLLELLVRAAVEVVIEEFVDVTKSLVTFGVWVCLPPNLPST